MTTTMRDILNQALYGTCTLCYRSLDNGEKNSAWPIAHGICCDDCADSYVYQARCAVLMSEALDSSTVH